MEVGQSPLALLELIQARVRSQVGQVQPDGATRSLRMCNQIDYPGSQFGAVGITSLLF
jgi:hypothetical protein